MQDDVAADWEWANKFLPHQAQVAREALRVDVAPIEDDMRRNTDLILRSAVPLRLGRELRISARVRRHEHLKRFEHARGIEYRKQFTIRDRRPSGVPTEMHKLRLGEGDIFIYGFEAEPGSDQLYPWAVINLELLREYDKFGGYSAVKRNKGERGSWLRAFHYDDMPIGTVLRSDGIEFAEHDAPWLECRNPNWDDTARPVRSGWCSRAYAIAEEYTRRCLFCGFQWRSGWSPT